MHKFLRIGTVVLLAAGALAVGVGADADQPRQVADGDRVTAERVSELPAAMERLERMADRISAQVESEFEPFGRVKCTTVECLNRELTRLSRFANRTAERLDSLDVFARDQLDAWKGWYDEWNTCVPVAPVTQYPGYMYTTDGTNYFATTGLDYTEEGSEVDNWVLVWTCEVAE